MHESIPTQYEMINQQIRELSGVYHSAASRSGISDNELWVWYALLIVGGEYSQQEICDMWSLPKQTVNSTTASLSKRGLITLEAIPGTRNRKLLRLTEEGKRYGERMIMPLYHAEQQALGKMSEQERQACVALLGKYIALLKDELHET